MKMIASWGSSGSGKSTFALALATKLTKARKNVLIISADLKTPALPIWLPNLKLDSNNSLSLLLSSDKITYEGLRSKIHIHPDNERLGFIGYASCENPIINNKNVTREQIITLLSVLDNSPFDYVIFDCDSNIIFDTFSLLAVELSDFVFEIITADVKGLEFIKSSLSWMKNSDNFDTDKHIKIANIYYDSTPIKEFKTVCNIQYQLPFSTEVYNKFCSGEILEKFNQRDGIKFEAEAEKISEVILNE